MIDGRCAEMPMTMTFQTALKIYRTAVQNQFPQGPDSRTARRGVAQVNQRGGGAQGRGGRARDRRGGNGRGGRCGGRGNNQNQNAFRNHPD